MTEREVYDAIESAVEDLRAELFAEIHHLERQIEQLEGERQ